MMKTITLHRIPKWFSFLISAGGWSDMKVRANKKRALRLSPYRQIAFLIVYLQQMENSEKGVGKAAPAILTFLYQLRVIREQYFILEYFVFFMELVFMLNFCLQQAVELADAPLAAVVQVYKTYVIDAKMTVLVISLFSLFFMVLAIVTVLSLYYQSQLDYTSKQHRYLQKARKIYLAVFILFEGIVVPALVLSLHNIVHQVLPDIFIVNYLTLPFLVMLVFLEKNRRFYQGHILSILLTWSIANGLTSFVVGLISLRLGWMEQSRPQMKIAYYQFAILSSFVILSQKVGQNIDSFYLLFALVITAALVIINNENTYTFDQITANRKMMRLIEKIVDNKILSIGERMFINREICRFREELSVTQKYHLTEDQRKWLESNIQGILKEDLLLFLKLKMDFSLRRQYTHKLKMQSLECSVRFKTFNMKILYEIQKLTKQIKAESTFQQQQKLYQLVNLTDRKFLKKGQSLNASTVISVQKETQQLYEYFINIAIIMQELWTLHSKNSLTQKIMRKILDKVTTMESEADDILSRISKFNYVRHQMIVYEMVKRLNSNSYKPKEFNEYERANEEITNSEYMNYILIQQGNILDMSNRLLNDFQMTKKQAEGYCLSDIVNEQLNSYLTLHLDYLIEEEVHHQQANFILPLKISRDHQYIQPFKTRISLLPELINGIKYIIHLEKTTDLQKVPFLLYSGKSDSIVGITKNFKQYFRMESDHYLFNNYTHQLFNVDILSVYTQNKEFQTIICEFNAKKTNTTTKGNKLRQVPVILKNIKQYENIDDSLILMSIVKRQDFERTEITNLISEKLLFEGTNGIITKPASDPAAYLSSHQTCVRFCRISNPYENLIDEKISKMNEFYRMSYLKGIFILVATIILTIITALAVMAIQTDSYSTSIRKNYDSDILQNDKAINLFQLYTQSSILYQLNTYPQQYSQINPNLNISQLIQLYSSLTSKNIKTILTSQVKTDLQSYKSTGQNATVYDIVQNAKESIVSKSISPMIISWPSLRHISTNQTITSDSLSNLCYFFDYFTIFCLSFISLLILAIELVSYQVQEVSHEILYIYEKIDRQHSQRFVQVYKIFTHELYSSSYFRGVKSNEYLQCYKNKKDLESIQEMSTLIYLQGKMHIDLQRQENSAANKADISQVIKKDMKFAFIYKESFISLIILFLLCFLQLFLYQTHQYQTQFSELISHSIGLHQARGNVSFNTAHFMVTSLQETVPLKSRLNRQLPTKMYLETELIQQLPSFYKDYVTKKQSFVNTNLCMLDDINPNPLFTGTKCEEFIGGVLSIGYAEALIMYNDMVNDYGFNSMSNFSNLKRKNALYPVFFEIIYVKVCLFGILTSLQNNFMEYTHRYIAIWDERLSYLINLGWLLLPLTIALTLLLYLKIRFRCCICLKSFFILPKDYLLEMKVTKILRQKGILDYIQKLAF